MSEHIVRMPPDMPYEIRAELNAWYIASEPIVRCRDCDLSYEDELGNLRCHGPLVETWDYYNDEMSDGVKVDPDGFCKWGEPKEGSE